MVIFVMSVTFGEFRNVRRFT